jgi:hypothetical protein
VEESVRDAEARREAGGLRGKHLSIADCHLPVFDWLLSEDAFSIGNRKSQIGNRK